MCIKSVKDRSVYVLLKIAVNCLDNKQMLINFYTCQSVLTWRICYYVTDLSAAKLKRQPNISLNKQIVKDMVLVSANKMLIALYEQRKVILVNIASGQVLSEIALKIKPRYICMTSVHLGATTLEGTIMFIQVKDNIIKADTTLNLDVDVMGIAAYKSNLVVTYDHPGVKIISKDGTEVHKLDNSIAGRQVFKNPRRIATTSDDSIYIADWGTHEITRLDSCLTILQKFSGPLLNYPLGILSINRDQLLVCSKRNDSIVMIQPITNTMAVLLEKKHGIESPVALCFCGVQKNLYVAPDSGNVLVYQLS